MHGGAPYRGSGGAAGTLPPFRNEPVLDLARADDREALLAGLATRG